MLHILCLVIKWIGILLVFLLALISVAVALVLFCPLKYRAKIQKTVGEWGAQGKVSWLFGLFGVTVRGGSEKIDVEIRICGIRLSFLKKIFSRKKKVEKKKPEPRDSQPVTDKSHTEKAIPEDLGQPEEENTIPALDIGQAGGKEGQAKEGLLKRFWMKIVEKCRGIKRAFLKFIAMVQNIHDKINIWKGFLKDPHTGAAIGTVWQQANKLLRHAGPQKMEGFVNFGLEDPAATGQVLAILGVTYPLYGRRFSINPVWDKKVLEGKAYVKGRVYGIMLLYMACRIYFDRDVKYVINWFRQNGGNYVTGK